MRKLIFTSKGLNQKIGRRLISKELAKDDLADKRIILFTLAEYYIDDILRKFCLDVGFKDENITIYDGEKSVKIVDSSYQYVYVTEGNTFDIAYMLKKNGADKLIRNMVVNDNATYIGASAGAILAGADYFLATEFDKDRVGTTDYTGLNLFGKKATIIPHYTKKEFERFKRCMEKTEPEVLSRYDEMYYVSNYGIVVMEV